MVAPCRADITAEQAETVRRELTDGVIERSSLDRIPADGFDWVIVVGFCVLGSYAVNNSMFDVIVMFFAGIIGFICKKADIPLGPFILALLLGPIAESNFRRSMALSMGDASIFFTRPITVVLLLLTAASLIVPVVREGMKRKKSQVPA